MLASKQSQVARLGAGRQAVLRQQPPPLAVGLATFGGQRPVVVFGRLGIAGGRLALGLERQQAFQRGQRFFRRLQPHDQRPTPLGQPLVERVALGAGLGELLGQQSRLFMAVVDPPGGSPLEQNFRSARDAGGQHSRHGPRSPHGRGQGSRQQQAGQPQQHESAADDEQPAEAGQHPGREHLFFERLLALLFELRLAAAHLVEPLVKLHAAAKLRYELAGLGQPLGEPLVFGRSQGGVDLLIEFGDRGRVGGPLAAKVLERAAGAREPLGGASQFGDATLAERFAATRGARRCRPDSRTFGVQSGQLALELGQAALERFKPRLLLGQGLQPRGSSNQRLVDRQRVDLAAQPATLLLKLPVSTSPHGQPCAETLESRQRPLGQRRQRAHRLQLLINCLPPLPARTQCPRQGQLAGMPIELGGGGFQLGDLEVELLRASESVA